MKLKEIKLRLTSKEYEELYSKVIKSRVARIQNGQAVPCMVKYIKLQLGIKYEE